jgi:hypothetical protein
MKILLQHNRTKLFLRSLGSWTHVTDEAHDFKHSQRLLDFVHNNGLDGVQIAVQFSDQQYNEVFPIPPRQAVAFGRG